MSTDAAELLMIIDAHTREAERKIEVPEPPSFRAEGHLRVAE